MPRTARIFNQQKIYHITIRGINKQDIFLEESDKIKFLKDLESVKKKFIFEIYAYCLMDNHVHIIIKDIDDKLSKIMQSLSIRYAKYFNTKYERVGHFFQNRYNSQNIKENRYLLVAQKYIHQNPEVAGISRTDKYKWSSYNEYISANKLCNTDYILNIFNENEAIAKEMFKKFTLEKTNKIEQIWKFEGINRIEDIEAIKIIKDVLKIENIAEILEYNKIKRDNILAQIKENTLIGTNQISRILGISRKIVERATKT